MADLFDMFRLDGRVALITGGAGGLGTVFAHTLAAAGADVVLLGRRLEAVQSLADAVTRATGRRAIALSADVTVEAQVRAASDHALATLGHVDILINSAGVNIRKPALSVTAAEWQQVLQVNLTGPFLCAQA